MDTTASSASPHVTNDSLTANVTSLLTSLGEAAAPPTALHYYHVIYLSVAMVIGVPGNALLATAYAYVKQKSSCDWYIVYLALLDLVVCLVIVPTYLSMETGYWQNKGTNSLCKSVHWLSHSVTTATVIVFGVIAVDRYLQACKPTVKACPHFARYCVLIISVCAALSAVPSAWTVASRAEDQCVVAPTLMPMELTSVYYTSRFVLFLAVCLIVIVCYACALATVRTCPMSVTMQGSRAKPSGDRTTARARGKARRNRVGVEASDTDDVWEEGVSSSAGTGGDRGRDKGKGRVPSERELESLSSIARKLCNPTMKWAGDYCLLDLKHPRPSLAGVTPKDELFPRTLVPRAPTIGSDVIAGVQWTNVPACRSLKDAAIGETGAVACAATGKETAVFADFAGHHDGNDQGNDSLSFASESLNEISTESHTTKELTDDNSLSHDTSPSHSHLAEHQITASENAAENPNGKADVKDSGKAAAVGERAQSTGSLLPHPDQRNKRSDLQMNGKAGAVALDTFENLSLGEEKDHDECAVRETQSRGSMGEAGCSRQGPQTDTVDSEHRASRTSRTAAVIFTTTRRLSAELGPRDVSLEGRSEAQRISGSRNKSKTATNVAGKSSTARTARAFRLTVLLLVVTVVFVVSRVPPYAAVVWLLYARDAPPLATSQHALQTYASTGYVLNHFATPLLFLAFSPAFREAAVALWTRLCSRGS